MIQLEHCRLEYTPQGAVTHFEDGPSWGALPHDVPHYHALAHRLGYQGDILAYCREHELAHHVVAEVFGLPSMVIHALAHGRKPFARTAASEEALALALQRYVRTNEHPFIDRFPWEQAKERFLRLLGEVQ